MTSLATHGPSTWLNPAWIEAESYIAFLNQSFPGKWDQVSYDWYIKRDFNGRSSDLIVRTGAETILSGMAMCYRQISVGAGAAIDVAVISSAATLPQERGRGHYRRLLQDTIVQARRRGCAAILGFMTRENASGRGLARLGARVIPGFYVIGNHRAVARQRAYTDRRRGAALASTDPHGVFDDILARFMQDGGRHARRARGAPQAQFYYQQTADWRRQFIDRPNGVCSVQPARHSLALVESVQATDRLQWLGGPAAEFTAALAALAANSTSVQRDFFLYTLDDREAVAARRLGCEIRGGYLMLLPTGYSKRAWNLLANASWRIQSGDRL